MDGVLISESMLILLVFCLNTGCARFVGSKKWGDSVFYWRFECAMPGFNSSLNLSISFTLGDALETTQYPARLPVTEHARRVFQLGTDL
jgi:hypothetical protein